MRLIHIIILLIACYSSSCQTAAFSDNEGPKQYGVKWSTTDFDDLGVRCFDAKGRKASIGIGRNDGYSDFDRIYPWSEIKRCNIKKDANDTALITFEGEPGFTLDGSNGDVFVRIPKFRVKKYIENGYEYRIVSRSEGTVHPAFVEDGKELTEIYVGAFEGYVDNGRLMSIAGVIPSSNIIAQDFLDAAKVKGVGYSLYDMRTVDAIWTLYCVEYGSRNTNQYLGFGFADYMQPLVSDKLTVIENASSTNSIRVPLMAEAYKQMMPKGSNITVCDTEQSNILTQAKILSIRDGVDYTEFTFDGKPITVSTKCFIGSAACTTNFSESCGESIKLTWHTGRALFVSGRNQEMQNPVRYRWIENIIGSLWHFLPDVSFNSLQMYVCDNIRDYSICQTGGSYNPVGVILPEQTDNGHKDDMRGVNHWITSIVDNDINIASVFGKSFSDDLSCRQAFGGYYYLDSKNVSVVNGGGFDHVNRCNMLTNRAWHESDTRWYLYGARLIYKKIDY